MERYLKWHIIKNCSPSPVPQLGLELLSKAGVAKLWIMVGDLDGGGVGCMKLLIQ